MMERVFDKYLIYSTHEHFVSFAVNNFLFSDGACDVHSRLHDFRYLPSYHLSNDRTMHLGNIRQMPAKVQDHVV